MLASVMLSTVSDRLNEQDVLKCPNDACLLHYRAAFDSQRHERLPVCRNGNTWILCSDMFRENCLLHGTSHDAQVTNVRMLSFTGQKFT
jgi:hypothetical protein